MSVSDIKSTEEFEKLRKEHGLVVVYFWADWSEECGAMAKVFQLLASDPELKDVRFGRVAAENVPEVSLKCQVVAVPTFVFLREGQLIDRLDGANAAQLTRMVKLEATKARNLATTKPPVIAPTDLAPNNTSVDLDSRLKSLINQAPVMLFMKGTADAPVCGFSRQTVALLNHHQVPFQTFDILKDEAVRQGLKTYSNWPTYPQLYAKGELVGGLDILKELDAAGELAPLLREAVAASESSQTGESLDSRLSKLIRRAPVMVFMKGDPSAPRCGFSKTLVAMLNKTEVPYSTFDILTDDDVRQGLKTYSNWPTYPQVYVNGELVGGLDILKELEANGELLSTLRPSPS